MTKKSLLFPFASFALVAALTSCSSKLGMLGADSFTVTPNPLEAHAGMVPTTINGTFPEKYMKKKAQVTVTPVLRWNGGEAKGNPATFQGEKVKGNNQTISYAIGGSYTMRAAYPFQDGMQRSDLYLTFNAQVGNKVVNIPDVQIATGVISTSELVKETLKSANGSIAKDAFQRIIQAKQEATIQFLLGQANLRASELNSNNVKEFIAKLKEIKDNVETNKLNNIEVSAYASPDGKYNFNEKLAGKREQNSTKYIKDNLKKNQQQADVDTKYTAEDWEGFQELVAQSNIQDKDLIIRVLSMYSDPEEREREIKNISVVYGDLAETILPKLRRARLTANYEIIGRSDEQITAQFKSDASKLSLEEILYAATLTDNAAQKEAIYKKATQLYSKDARAFNNLATLAYQTGDLNKASDYLSQALKVNSSLPEANANCGLVALAKGDKQSAAQYLSKGSGADGLNEALSALYIAQGQYAQAAAAAKGANSNTAALAQILNKDYTAASTTLAGVKNANAMTYYLKAIQSARTGNASDVTANLKKAIAADPSLRTKAINDLEFLNCPNAVSNALN